MYPIMLESPSPLRMLLFPYALFFIPSKVLINPTRIHLTCFTKRYLDLKKIEAEVVSACRLTFLLGEGVVFFLIVLRLFHQTSAYTSSEITITPCIDCG